MPDSYHAIQDYCWEQGWTDGLPVVPPTEPLVREMLSAFGQDPAKTLGVMQPRNARVTLEKLAINAVMAGCLPEHFPVVVAAVRAVLQEEFNLAGNAATTGGAAQVVIVNGPVARTLGINGDAACFGPGFRANAVIGRALRLVIRNLGGLVPGEMDKATQATPGRYSFCFSENEERSPWEPRHLELGYPASASTVTVVGVRSYYQLGTGAQIVLVLCPEHAADIAGSGLSKSDVREYIYQNARMPLHRLKDLGHYGNRNWPAWIDETDQETLVPVVRAAEDIVVLVAGGDGRHSAWLAGWGVTRLVTEEIIG